MKNNDLVGTKINEIKILAHHTGKSPNGHRFTRFTCQCHCGKQWDCACGDITRGRTKSCGCDKGGRNKLPDNAAMKNAVLATYKNGAKKRGLSFSLTGEEFDSLIFGNCHYCGRPPKLVTWKGKTHRGGRRDRERTLVHNGIDRVDNSVGYERENCVSCCWICNHAKNKMTLAEFTDWVRDLCKTMVSNPR